MSLNKRELILLLTALGASAAFTAQAQPAGIDLSAARAVGVAYRAAHPEENFAAMRRELPDLNVDAIHRLRNAAAEDFRTGNIFVYQGWRLSRTEGRLFALLSGA